MLIKVLWPAETGVAIDDVCLVEQTVVITAHGTQVSALCPKCSVKSERRNGSYHRHPTDLPCAGYTIKLHLSVPRFFCDNDECECCTFAATFPAFLAPYAQRTDRLQQQQREVGFAIAAEEGARLLPSLQMRTSSDTLLRMVRGAPESTAATPRVLGVDDWAKRKGRTYGTILVDLEQCRVIDLLEDRSAESLAHWLQAHPGVKIISRDRGNEYIEGSTSGAPQTIQVADRFHLLQNMVDALKRLMATIRILCSVERQIAGPGDAVPVCKHEFFQMPFQGELLRCS